MTMHVSLPKELEIMVHDHVKSGMYQSVSEVVREALRSYFKGKDSFTDDQIGWIRREIGHRLEDVKSGRAKLMDADRYFDEADKRLSKKK
jgi:antitoxin ParD1/3/4